MAKKFLVTLVAFVTVFFLQAQVWAAANHADKVAQTQNYTVDTSAFFTEEAQAPYQLARTMGSGGANSMLWIASIFVTGLGQILMGDLWRGLKFTLIVIGIYVVQAVLGGILVSGAVSNPGGFAGLAGIWGIVSLVLWLGALAVHIWNIIDAYNMSQEMGGMSKVKAEDLAKIQNELMAAMELAQNVKVQDGNFSVKALAF